MTFFSFFLATGAALERNTSMYMQVYSVSAFECMCVHPDLSVPCILKHDSANIYEESVIIVFFSKSLLILQISQ